MSVIFQILSLLPNGFSVLQCAIRKSSSLSVSHKLEQDEVTCKSWQTFGISHFFSLFQPLKPKMHSEIVGMGRVEFGLGFGFLIMGLFFSPKNMSIWARYGN